MFTQVGKTITSKCPTDTHFLRHIILDQLCPTEIAH